MPTRSDSGLRGPVHTVRFETDTWDAAAEQWALRATGSFETFRPDGNLASRESRTPDGAIHREVLLYDAAGRLLEGQVWRDANRVSTTVYAYDPAGRLERLTSVAPDGTRNDIESFTYDSAGRKARIQYTDERLVTGGSTNLFTDAEPVGARPATITTTYDERDLPIEDVSHDSQHIVVGRTTYERDGDGRLLREERFIAPTTLFSGLHDDFARLSPEKRAQFEAIVAAAMPGGAFGSKTVAYDRDGRVLEERTTMGTMMEEVTTYQYDRHGNPVEVSDETSAREVGADESGRAVSRNEEATAHVTRYEYKYDAHDNWIERVTTSRSHDESDFWPTTRERRTITYYAAQ